MFREQHVVLTFATLAITGTAALIWWWRFQLKKRRAKREALMALAVHEENQSKKSQSKEKDKEERLGHATADGSIVDEGGDNKLVTRIWPMNIHVNPSPFSFRQR
ncbi:uncharacterized protein LOC126267008 isoform X3 [Schistocerca gregaria]|uniref:uncharacterized protein LOC126267008 isoform X3 n=1 Tax=Schistocerca gregaria TaxID=7010 RepID=UPI00211E7953|nr:uncharacterized protein LOC126267008 isoform X3 [Schistocerca gregaria]